MVRIDGKANHTAILSDRADHVFAFVAQGRVPRVGICMGDGNGQLGEVCDLIALSSSNKTSASVFANSVFPTPEFECLWSTFLGVP